MTRPRNATMVAEHEDTAAWESWGDESPVFDDSELLTSLAAKRPTTSRPATPLVEELPPEPVASGLATQLTGTPAPATGILAVNPEQPNALANLIAEFTGTGHYASSKTGRIEQRAVVVTVDREANGRHIGTYGLPGAPARTDSWSPPRGAHPGAAVKWLGSVLLGVREATDLPILVVLNQATFPLAKLEPLARSAACVVAVVQQRPGLASATWQPRLLEPLPQPEAPEPPAKPKHPTTKVPAKPTADACWLARVPELVRDLPEMIAGPRGEHIRTAYWGRDARRGEYVLMTGFSEHQGRNWPLELELVPGVWVALEDTRVYRGAI
jgi:hypothetical protein